MMYNTFQYTGNLIFALLVFATFLLLCGCAGCGNGEKNLTDEAKQLSTQFDSLAISFNTMRGDFEREGDRDNEIKAEDLRDKMKDVKNQIDEYLNDDDINQNKIDIWSDSFEEFKKISADIGAAETPPNNDRDGDGILDEDDDCPDEAGKGENGCPKDTDGDGVIDKEDDCPNRRGTRSNKGCPEATNPTPPTNTPTTPQDTDGDGIYDMYDRCIHIFGLEEYNGCPPPADSDGDGIRDDMDKCPDLVGISPDGCPAIKCTEESRFTFNEISTLCSPVLRNCTLTIRPKSRMILEEFQIVASTGGGLVDYLLKDNLGNTIFNYPNATTALENSQFLVDQPLQANRSYQLILIPKGDLSIKTFCVNNFKNEKVSLSYANKPFIHQITFCQ